MKKQSARTFHAEVIGWFAIAMVGGQAAGAVMDVNLGETISRTWDDVEKDDYAYAPKQAFDAKTGETQIWLPYGSRGVFYETSGIRLSNPGKAGTGSPLATTPDGNTSARLVYKLRFDKPIGGFRAYLGWSEWGVGNGTVGGADYSVDGRNWTILREVAAGGIVEPLLDPAKVKVDGLSTRELYLRFFSRDKANPAAGFGSNRWMKLRLAGDPAWGDRVETFFKVQPQIWVVPSGRPADATASEAPAAAEAPTAVRADVKPLDNAGPWAVASGAEWAGDYPKFNPMLKAAGVRWLRYFPEWHSIQPRQGEWRWDHADSMVASARENGIQMTGVFAYFAAWASADGGMRRGPVKDIQYWRDYVRATTARYRNDIRHWEIWNEFNGSFYQGVDKPAEYAALTVAAYEEAKKSDPGIQIGMSVANFDVGFLDAAIKAGAADHFDFVCVHPYENSGTLKSGGESGFLSLAGSLRRMLKANNQREDIPLWISEAGVQSTIGPDPAADAVQADGLAKLYVLALAQGFERVCWFEARGPAYGKGTDHGLIRKDWTIRPAYTAMQTLAKNLGAAPAYAGWLKFGETGYGFVFGDVANAVLVAWMPPEGRESATFDGPVDVVSLSGDLRKLPAGEPLDLTSTPVLVAGLPWALAERALAQKGQPFPWGTDFSKLAEASCRLGAINQENGIKQTNPKTTEVVNGLVESWRRTNFAYGGEGRYIYFRVDPTFAGFGNRRLEITVVAKRASPDKNAGMNLTYESLKGYRGADGWFTIPAGEGWHEHTWKVEDANFVGAWGWNFRTDAVSSPNEFHVKEVRVKRVD